MAIGRGIKFTDITSGVTKNTAIDWDLIMSEKLIGMAEPRVLKVDMPDRDGYLDLSEAVRGRVSYKNRALSFTFICTDKYSNWATLRSTIAGFLHGKRMKIEDPDTPNKYYIGRCILQEPSYIGEAVMFLTVTVDAYPYLLTTRTFIREVSAGGTANLVGSASTVRVTVTASAAMTIEYPSTRGSTISVTLQSGQTSELPYFKFAEVGQTIVKITAGSGTLTYNLEEGEI